MKNWIEILVSSGLVCVISRSDFGNEFVYGCVDFYTRLAISNEICFFSTLTFCSFAKLITDLITFRREEGKIENKVNMVKKQIRCFKEPQDFHIECKSDNHRKCLQKFQLFFPIFVTKSKMISNIKIAK